MLYVCVGSTCLFIYSNQNVHRSMLALKPVGYCSLLLLALLVCQQNLAFLGLQIHHSVFCLLSSCVILFVRLHIVFPLCVPMSKSFSFYNGNIIYPFWIKAHLDNLITWLNFQSYYLQIRSYSECWYLGLQHILGGHIIQPITFGITIKESDTKMN